MRESLPNLEEYWIGWKKLIVIFKGQAMFSFVTFSFWYLYKKLGRLLRGSTVSKNGPHSPVIIFIMYVDDIVILLAQ